MNPLVPAIVAGVMLLGLPTPAPGGDTEITGVDGGRTKELVLRNSRIVISGDGARGGKRDGFQLRNPCWYEPAMTPDEMLKFREDTLPYFNRYGSKDAGTPEEYLQPAKDKIGKPGQWWQMSFAEGDTRAVDCFTTRPSFVFVPPGTTPENGITIQQLTDIARAALTVPEPTVKLNPDAKSYVNLPTFVWLEGIGQPRRSVTATLPGVMSATVVATLENFKIDPGTTADRAEVREDGCGSTGKQYVKGAQFTCGVRYLRASIDQPRENYVLTVTTVWPVEVADQVVPFQYAPVQTDTTRDVPVGEVQSNVKP
ncbi:hypothetical protein [Nonomuraea turcica]|uniref:hypothetical protein n=1 Tax=Nonomuraea sp. G32 TaxID=3067274 RepID=UPI00273A8C93|nr:hypothetical protein [Nonomuraea sp. G32]MDP4506648.1 hypothetical protein [Nonomuraea sp. G32]